MTAHDAWQRLIASYASASRGRIISLKAKLTRNPRGSRSITTYLNDMRAIADDLALAQCPVSDKDLLVYVLTQLGEDYSSITSAIRVREKPLSFGELAAVLTDHEGQLTDADALRQSFFTTTNVTQRTSSPSRRNHQSNTNRRARNNNNHYGSNRQQGEHNRSGIVCKFCYLTGHETRVCCKLARFLKEHDVPPVQSYVSPTTNSMTGDSPPWMFDSGVLHHVTPSLAPLQTFTEYSGSDEIRLGDVSMSSLRKFYCSSCNVHKSHKLPFSKNTLVSTKPLQLVYTDVWGPTENSIDEFRYYVIFVDHFSKYIWLYP
ncbi:PREDICTED: uncharacterized protein LOC109178647 [Ipomoea nil]|uniref:uncharacterized protein LOC109178647 n=1 Tax=Ipomoea nil TaxID=35883 RepID=UPI0009019CCE|nr:PREDICTED: uncharacterized protein LOC109178647 [Ipomoea nil]